MITSGLSDQGAAIMTHALDQMREKFEASFAGRRAVDVRLEGLLKSDPFDKAAFLAVKKEDRTRHAELETEADAIFADSVAQLSADDRRRLAGELARHAHGGPFPH
jgi:uncharacterized membrane protein